MLLGHVDEDELQVGSTCSILLLLVRSISDFLLEMRTQHADDDTVEANFLPLEAISDVLEDEAGFQGLEPYSDVLGFRSSAIPFQTAWDLA